MPAKTCSHLYYQAKTWAAKGEFQGAFIVIEALWKKDPSQIQYLLALLELFEEINPIKAFSFFSDVLSGDDLWLHFISTLNTPQTALLFEKHGLMALRLKDENTALESLKRAASLGRDSLLLWSALSYLLALSKDVNYSLKALFRSLELYREPTLFEDDVFLDSPPLSRQNKVDDDLFLNISLNLMPQMPAKEAKKLLGVIQNTFPQRSWVQEVNTMLQEIVSQESTAVPIRKSGDNYASTDTENW